MTDNLPITPLADIEWDFVTCWRILTMVLILVFVIQMTVMLSHYWHWLMPLRRDIEQGEGNVIAPPIGWTFAYHLVVTIILTVVGVGMGQSVYYDNDPTLFTFTGPLMLGALMVVTNRFLNYYSAGLRQGAQRAHRQD